MPIARVASGSLGAPGISATSSPRVYSQSSQIATKGQENNAPARAAAAPAILQCIVVGGRPVSVDSARASHKARSDNYKAAPRRAATGYGGDSVLASAGAPATTKHNPARRALGECNAAEAAPSEIRVPGIPADPARAAIAAAAAARVLAGRGIVISAAASGISRRSARYRATWVTFNSVINDRIG